MYTNARVVVMSCTQVQGAIYLCNSSYTYEYQNNYICGYPKVFAFSAKKIEHNSKFLDPIDILYTIIGILNQTLIIVYNMLKWVLTLNAKV